MTPPHLLPNRGGTAADMASAPVARPLDLSALRPVSHWTGKRRRHHKRNKRNI